MVALVGLLLTGIGSSEPAAAVDGREITGTIVLPEGVHLPPDDVVTVEAWHGDHEVASSVVQLDDLAFVVGSGSHGDVELLVRESSGAVVDGWFTGEATSWVRADARKVSGGSDVTVHLDVAVAIEGSIVLPGGLRSDRVDVGIIAFGPMSGSGRRVQDASVSVSPGGITYRIGGLRRGEQYGVRLWDESRLLVAGDAGGPDGQLVDDRERAMSITAPATINLAPRATPFLAGTMRLPEGVLAADTNVQVTVNEVGSDLEISADAEPDPLEPRALSFAIPVPSRTATYTISVTDRESTVAMGYLGPDGWQPGSGGARQLEPSTDWLDLDLARAAAFTGRVILPVGLDFDRGLPVVSVRTAGKTVAYGHVSRDGEFEVRGLLPGGTYEVYLNDSSKQLVQGRVLADGTVAPDDEASTALAPGPITIRTELTGRLWVKVTVSDGSRGTIEVSVVGDSVVSGTVDGSGTAMIPGLEAGQEYHVFVTGNGYGRGWYDGENRQLSREPGVIVRAGDSISVVVRPEFSILPRFTFPAGYCSQSLDNALVWLSRLEPQGWQFETAHDVDSWMAPEFGHLDPYATYALSIWSGDEDVEQVGYVAADGRVGVTIDEAARFTGDARITVPIHLSPGSRHVLRSTAGPVISGAPRVGVAMIASGAMWSREGTKTSLQWFRGGVPISGATSPSYVPTSADIGASLTVRATGWTDECSAVQADSRPTVKVAAGTIAATKAPTISGSAAVGARLSTTSGSWSVPGLEYHYQWLRGSAAIPGATGSTYMLSSADRGAKVAVRVSASRSGYVTASATSGATVVVRPGTIINRSRPSIAGTAKVGKKLKAGSGKWSVTGVTYRYQWYRDGKTIRGATRSSWTLTTKDVGTRVTVRVTASRAGYTNASATSKATATVRRR
ncbi:hypothetical protein [Cellulomonas sp. HZM]|uniref:hypothetical protein n=1 Tax=Cellulomonas sp. HZM TaxID=1454010 RepID=UPI00068ABE26|nr:hypothetical protein [Cellulomonas sp. HZM]